MKSNFELEIFFDNIFKKLGKKANLKFVFIYFVVVFYVSIPGFNIPLLEYNDIWFSGVMEQRTIENFFFYYPSQNWVSYEKINPYLKYGSVAMEDGAFVSHKGIDWDAIYESLYANKRKGRVVRGGSTITMQTAKNIFFTTRRSYFRKAKEILTAIRMEKELSKKRILEQYLNIIELGDGIFGVGSASEKYFKKDQSSLSQIQSASIIAVIPSPLKHTPQDNHGFTARRKGIVLGRMFTVLIP